MRIVILSAIAATLLGSGIAVSLQAIRAPIQPLEALREPSEAAAAPTIVVASEPTPFDFRQVRTVAVVEPGAGQPNAAAAAPAEIPRTDEIQPALRVNADEDRRAATADAKAPAAPSAPIAVASLPKRQARAERQARDVTSVPSPQESKQAEVSADRPATRARHTWKRSSGLAKQSRRARRKAEIAATEEPPAAPPAYDGRNENHGPFSSLGKLFNGAQ
jgi:hypothetical protein